MARHHHRRWGRDAATGGKKFSLLAGAAGFLALPAAVGMLATIATKPAAGFLALPAAVGMLATIATKPAAGQAGMTPQKQAQIFAGAHAAALVGAWYGAKKLAPAHSFLRGAMWGEAIVTPLALYEMTAIPAGTTATTAALPAGPTAQLQAIADKLVRGNWFKS